MAAKSHVQGQVRAQPFGAYRIGIAVDALTPTSGKSCQSMLTQQLHIKAELAVIGYTHNHLHQLTSLSPGKICRPLEISCAHRTGGRCCNLSVSLPPSS